MGAVGRSTAQHKQQRSDTQGGSEGSGVAGQESKTYPGHTPGRAGDVCQACSETSTHGAAAPGEVDLDSLRAGGLSEEQVLDVVLVACLFNFMTRLADGLGVEVELGKEKAVNRWLQVRPGAEWDWLRHNPGERPADHRQGE